MAGLERSQVRNKKYKKSNSAKIFSILLRAIVTRCPVGNSDNALLTSNNIDSYGRMCFTQLVELRHRGAFATVAQTFASFCRRCVTCDDKFLSSLPELWYQV